MRPIALLFSGLTFALSMSPSLYADVNPAKVDSTDTDSPMISVEELQATANTQRLWLDLRSLDAYRIGHIPGARWFGETGDRSPETSPLETSSLETSTLEASSLQTSSLEDQLGKLGVTGREELVLYGGDLTTQSWTFWRLEQLGCQVRVLDGGLEAWRASGDELEQVSTEIEPATFKAENTSLAMVSVDELLQEYGQRGLTIVDLRDDVDWRQHSYDAPPFYSAGHVPDALPYSFQELIAKGSWPSAETIREEIKWIGPRSGTHAGLNGEFVLVGSNADDPRPALGYFLLRKAGLPVRVLDGGWHAWKNDELTPIVRILEASELKALLEPGNPELIADHRPPHLMLFDNRGDGAYFAGHLPGATSLAAEDFLNDFETYANTLWPGADRNTMPVAFYCYGRECVRSRYCATRAAQAGFRNLIWFREGLPGWKAAQLPIFTGRPQESITIPDTSTHHRP